MEDGGSKGAPHLLIYTIFFFDYLPLCRIIPCIIHQRRPHWQKGPPSHPTAAAVGSSGIQAVLAEARAASRRAKGPNNI